MRTYGLFFWILLVINPVQAEVYKWTDSKGIVHFSDKPHPDAEKIQLPKVQSYSSPSPVAEPADDSVSDETTTNEQDSVKSDVPKDTDVTKSPAYKNVSIIQPADQETIRNNQGYVSVIVQLEPELKVQDKLQLLFNGVPHGEPQAATVFALTNIDRGSHTISVDVLDAKGKVLKTSNKITIYMQRPRVGMVPATRR